MAGPRTGKSRANGAANGDTSNNKQSLTEAGDKELFGGNSGDYVSSIAVADGDDDMEDVQLNGRSLVGQYTCLLYTSLSGLATWRMFSSMVGA